ncbi:MAG: hypothetical protein Sapg2KO_48890 [Saprospiraceae bacterium]
MACNTESPKASIPSNVAYNLTEDLISELDWMNMPDEFVLENGSLKIAAIKETDFFINPEDSSNSSSAPFLYETIEGDFLAKALVQPDFSEQWNAVALMVHLDSLNWIKFAFENSDATGPSIVSVVTKGTSDDANGFILTGSQKVWLAIAKKENVYAMHWSLDNEKYHMARLTAMPRQPSVKIGIEAQSPVGEKATHQIHFFEVEEITVDYLRDINVEN